MGSEFDIKPGACALPSLNKIHQKLPGKVICVVIFVEFVEIQIRLLIGRFLSSLFIFLSENSATTKVNRTMTRIRKKYANYLSH